MYSSTNLGKKQSAPKTNYQDKRALYLHRPSPSSDNPVIANFDSQHVTIGAGVAIFHLATSRVVVCRHSIDNYWFLPKGRRDVNEDTCCGAEREGYEEVMSSSSSPRLFSAMLIVSSLDIEIASFHSRSSIASLNPTSKLMVIIQFLQLSLSGPNWLQYPVPHNTSSSGT